MAMRVLLIRGGAIGDFILTLPLFEAVRCAERDAEVDILGYEHIAQLALGRRYAAAVRRVDAPEWAPLFSPSGNLADPECEYLSSFDQILSVWPDEDSVIRRNLERAGARKVISVDPRPPEGRGIHAVEYMARQCARVGLEIEYREPQLFPSERDHWWAERYMRVTGAGERPLLGLHPGSGSAAKNWPAERYAAVARYWIGRRAGHVMIVAGPADEKAVGDLQAHVGDEGVFILQNESLPRVAACLARCEVFAGNDSGISHMAAAVRTPTCVVFGPTDPRVWRPWGPRVSVVESAGQGGDISEVPAQDVIRQVEALLRRA